MKIVEIFSSLQGEGSFSGNPTVFVRLAGCNLRCIYCDTPGSRTDGTDTDVSEIAREVISAGLKHVCITGGEPLLQAEELLSLLKILHESEKEISIETNGSIDFRPFQQYSSVCMDVKCPSSGEKSDLSLLLHIRKSDSVKFVIGTDDDLLYAHDVIGRNIRGEIFWSPVFGADYNPMITYIMKNQLPVRFQIQLHKILGIR